MGMRLDRFTERSQEALQAAQQAASALQHATVEPEHLLLALLRQQDGLVPSLLQRLEVAPQPLAARLESELEGRPKQYGGGDPAVGAALRTVLMAAFDEMSRLKDEYVSTEHLLLALAGRKGGEAYRLLSTAGVTPDRIYATLASVLCAASSTVATSCIRTKPPSLALITIRLNWSTFCRSVLVVTLETMK